MEPYQSLLNCTNFTIQDFQDLNLIKTISAVLCIIFTIVMLIVAVFLYVRRQECRKEGLLNELYFILLIGTIITEFVQASGVEHRFRYSMQEKVCQTLAFFNNWTSIMSFFYSLGMMCYLFYLLSLYLFPNTICNCQLISAHPKCKKSCLILAYIVFPILLSFLFALIPFKNNTYGLAGPWCWICSIDVNCKPVGLYDQIIYFVVYGFVGIVGLLATLVYIFKYLYLWCREERFATFNQAKGLMIRVLALTPFNLFYVIVVCLQLSVRITTAVQGRHHDKVIWGFHAVSIPLGHLIFPLGILITFFPKKRDDQPGPQPPRNRGAYQQLEGEINPNPEPFETGNPNIQQPEHKSTSKHVSTHEASSPTIITDSSAVKTVADTSKTDTSAFMTCLETSSPADGTDQVREDN